MTTGVFCLLLFSFMLTYLFMNLGRHPVTLMLLVVLISAIIHCYMNVLQCVLKIMLNADFVNPVPSKRFLVPVSH